MDAYYSFEVRVKDIDLRFKTSDAVFSPKSADRGTLALLSVADFQKTDKVLDLGCGYGIAGIAASRIIGAENVIMADIDSTAVELSKMNAAFNNVRGVKILQSDGFKNIRDKDFTIILSNPPYHVDFSVAKEFIEKGFNRLCIGGKLYMVTKRKDWYKNKLISVFGGTRIWEIDGYIVFMSEKKGCSYANAKHIKIRQRNKAD